MDKFVHQQNLNRYRMLLTETTNKAQHHQLLKLLAEEEAKDQHLPRQETVGRLSWLPLLCAVANTR